MSKRSVLGLIVPMIAAVVALPTAAMANTRNFHPSACQVVSGTATYIDAGHVANGSTTSRLVLWCPVITENLRDGATFGQFFADGFSAAQNGLVMRRCFTQINGTFTMCSPFEVSGTFGYPAVGVNHLLSATSSSPNDPNYFYYLEVTLDRAVNGLQNTLFGYRLGGAGL